MPKQIRNIKEELISDLKVLEAGQKPLQVRFLSIEEFVDMARQPGFTFARYGDGSFLCLQGRKGKNCDGVIYTPEQAQALINTLYDSTINHAIGSLARRVTNADSWLAERKIDIEWYDCDVMNTASSEGKLFPFIQFLRERRIIFCGPSHLKRLSGFPVLYFVECHPTKAFEEVDQLEDEISYQIEKLSCDTVLISAGLGASPTLISRLHSQYPKLVILDCGSIWDPYVGVLSRSGHKRLGYEGYKKLGWKNFNEDITKW